MPIDPTTGEYVAPQRPKNRFAIDAPEAPDGGLDIFSIGDVVKAPVRGIEGALRGVAGLVDIIPGVDTGVAERRTFGRSETLAGGLIEGAAQFLLPFAGASKALRATGWLAGGLADARAATAGAAAARAGLARITEGVAAGAVADFAAFGAHEERLSNLIQLAPALRNPVTDFLQASGDDNEALGRIKNVLEGAGLGAIFDAIPAVLAGTRAAREHIASGGAQDAVQKAFERGAKEYGGVEGAASAYDQLLGGREVPQERAAGADFLTTEGDLGADLKLPPPRDPKTGRIVGREKKPGGPVRRFSTEVPAGIDQPGTTIDEAAELVRRTDAEKGAIEELSRLDIREALKRELDVPQMIADVVKLDDPALLEQGKRLFDEFLAKDGGQLRSRLGFDPKDLPEDQKALWGLHHHGLDLRNFVGKDVDAVTMARVMERIIGDSGASTRVPKKTETQMLFEGAARAADILDLPVEDIAASFTQVDEVAKAGRELTALEEVLNLTAAPLAKMVRLWSDGPAGIDPRELKWLGIDPSAPKEEVAERALQELYRHLLVTQKADLLASVFGQGLRRRQGPISQRLAAKALDARGITSIDHLRSTLSDTDARNRLGALLISNIIDDDAVRLAYFQRIKDMPLGRRVLAFTQEWIISSLLWSPKTWVTNGAFPVMTSFYNGLERAVGGTIYGLKDPAGFASASKELHAVSGMMMSAGAAARLGRRSFKEGRGSLFDPGRASRFSGDVGPRSLISTEGANAVLHREWSPESIMGRVIDAIGRGMEIPGKFMTGSDDFTKTMTAQGLAIAELTSKALELKVDPTQFVAEGMDKMFRDGRVMTHEAVMSEARKRAAAENLPTASAQARRIEELKLVIEDEADFDLLNPITTKILDRAHEGTATARLGQGIRGAGEGEVREVPSLAKSYETFAAQHPFLRLVTPFIRTPANLASWAWQRSIDPTLNMVPKALWARYGPGGGLDKFRALADSNNRNLSDLASGNADRVSGAVGRLATATGILTGASMAAHSGLVTGAGPDDVQQRQVLLDAGWLPYAFNVNGTYVQYLRADPFSITMGLVADLVETSRLAAHDDEGYLEAATAGIINSISANFLNRTYMAGVRSLFDAATQPETFGGSFVANAAVMPVPRVFQQLKQAINDPVLRDAHSIVDRIRSRVPGFGSAPPLRNVLGEPIRSVGAVGPEALSQWSNMFIPVAYREVGDDPIRTELAALRHGFTPPKGAIEGVDLHSAKNASGRYAYDRWQELQGQVKVGGRTIRQELRRLIKSREYRDLSPESTPYESSPRVAAIKRVVRRYQERSLQEMLAEFPELAREIRDAKAASLELRAGRAAPASAGGVPAPYSSFQAAR